MIRLLNILLCSLLIGCGATPPPKVETVRPKLGSLAPTIQPLPFHQPHKAYIILGTKPLPDEDAVEQLFARKTKIAEVGPGPRGIEVSLPGVLCSIDPSEKPALMPRHFLPHEPAVHGLSPATAKAMAAATVVNLVRCEPNQGVPSRAMPEHAEVAAEVVAELTQGVIHDVHTGRYWPKEVWRTLRAAASRYDTKRIIRVLSAKNESGQWLIATRGLASFGRPDIVAFPVKDSQAAGVRTALVTLADILIEETTVGSGYTLSMGAVNARLIPMAKYLNATGLVAPKLDARGSGSVIAALVLADPAGEIGSEQQYHQFIRRLLIR